jgi:hypothetical protein
MIETNGYTNGKINDLCAVCSSIVYQTIADEFPDVFPKEYAFFGVKEGLALIHKIEYDNT